MLEILAEGEPRIAAFRQQLLSALGINAQLIAEVIPPVELVIGRQPPAPELPPAEAQNRFRLVFRRFIGVFAQAEHPLALFLDDLQWADSASLGLLEELVAHSEVRYLLVIGAYRDNEVSASHPLLLTLDEVRKAGAHISDIVIGPLSREHLTSFVSDTLRRRRGDVAPLSDLVHEKTAGNPFFAIQFLTALYEERLIEFDGRAEAWQWDVAKIRAKGFTDNVVDLMVEKLKRLPPATQEALKLAACLGNTAETPTLSMVHGRSEQETHADLWEAVRAGLLFRLGDTYRFLHDRVQEAAYSRIPEELRATVHLGIGRRLVSHMPEEAVAEQIFDVANQWNRGAPLITEPHEKESLFRLNFLAGRKAKASIAYASARGYLAQAAALLAKDAWSARYAETFALYLELAECEFLVSNFQRADELFSLILENARSDPDRAKACILRMRLYQIVGRPDDGVTVMIEALRLMGVDFPEADEALFAALNAELQEVSVNLRGRRIADLAFAPVTVDPDVRAIISLLVAAMPCANIGRPKVFPLIVVRALNFSLRYGNTEDACFAYSAYGTLLVSIIGDIPSAFEFSEMSMRLNEKFNDARLRGTILYLHAHFIHCWRRPFATVLPFLEKVFPACLEVGELVFASYHGFLSVWLTVEKGDTLDETLRVSRRYAAFTRECHNDVVYDAIRIEQQFVACLKGLTREPASFDDSAFNESECLAAATRANLGTVITFFHIAKQIACFTYGRYGEALEHAAQAAPTLAAVMATPAEATHHFYHALTLAALHAQAPAAQQQEFTRTLEGQLRKLELWADNCPENYLNRYALVSAEVARIEGRDLDAMRLYEEAIRSARENGVVQNEALACELTSRFYRARKFDQIADMYLRCARACYARWGADGKVQSLDRLYPELAPRPPGAATTTSTFMAAPAQLDLLSVVKALQSISSEILLQTLGETLLQIVLQQAGGEKGALILVRDGGLALQAEATTDGKEIRVESLQGVPASADAFPMSILHYVARTRDPVILNDAAESARFASDPHLVRRRPRSLLCFPIVRQARVSGLVYLENNLATGAFTADTIQVLELIGAQAAISLDNATLYADLERSRMQIEAVLDNMVDSVFVADRTGRITLVNQAAARLTGLASPVEARGPVMELMRRSHFEHADGTPYEVEQFPLSRALRGEMVVLDEGTISLPGAERRRYLHTSASPMRDAAGQVVGAVAVSRDVTELMELDRLKDQFLRVAAHELKTPVAVVMGYAETLSRMAKELAPSQRRMLDGLLRGAARIDRIVADLLFLSQVQLDRLNLVLERVDLGELVDRAAGRATPAAPARRIRITRAEPVVLQGDRELLERVVAHLIDNALRYSPDGGDVEVDVRIADAQDAIVSVRDHGVGIPAGKCARIFECFYRAHTDTSHDYGGMGTGLYLSRAVVVRHGGEMWFESEEGRGSTFHVRLPLTPEGVTAPS